ncbi:MAG: hypothetical protein ACLQVJ_13830 [Syntrophobacteraceae bacterium]
MFQNILLEPEQEDLLVKLVEAWRNVPRERRQRLFYAAVVGNDPSDPRSTIFHYGFPSGEIRAHIADIEVLVRNGLLLRERRSSTSGYLDVTPQGFGFYGHLKAKLGQPVERLQATVLNYLLSEAFQRDFPTAYQKWIEAEKHLWSTDSEPESSTIGHLCREAMQEFASALITLYKPLNIDSKIQDTVARIRAVRITGLHHWVRKRRLSLMLSCPTGELWLTLSRGRNMQDRRKVNRLFGRMEGGWSFKRLS